MNNAILRLLRNANLTGRPLTIQYIANQLHTNVPLVLTNLLVLRKQRSVVSWGSGTPYMFRWSATV